MEISGEFLTEKLYRIGRVVVDKSLHTQSADEVFSVISETMSYTLYGVLSAIKIIRILLNVWNQRQWEKYTVLSSA